MVIDGSFIEEMDKPKNAFVHTSYKFEKERKSIPRKGVSYFAFFILLVVVFIMIYNSLCLTSTNQKLKNDAFFIATKHNRKKPEEKGTKRQL